MNKTTEVMGYERISALREGHRNGSEHDYFNARPHNDTPTLRGVFCQGFDRGFDKGLEYAAQVQPVKQEPVTVEAAEKMGATGAEPTESERQLFEAWMRGHCWAVSGVFDGKTYVDSAETGGYINPHTMHTRCLWAAWRDRAALAIQIQPVKQEPVAWAYFDADGTFMDALDKQHGAYQTPLHAEPVSAEAIRADEQIKALEAARTIGGDWAAKFEQEYLK